MDPLSSELAGTALPRRSRWYRRRSLLAALVLLAGCRPSRGGSAETGSISVSHAVVTVPTSPAETTAFLLIENRGVEVQTLVAVTSPAASSVAIHREVGGQMQPQEPIAIAGHGQLRLAPGTVHLMLGDLRGSLSASDTVLLALRFTPGGTVQVRAPVLRFTEAVSEVP